MAPPAAAVAAVRHHSPHLLLRRGGGGLLSSPSGPATLPFASRGAASAPARLRLPPPQFSLSPVPKSLSAASSSHVIVRSLFTGIVEEVETKDLLAGTQLGDSVAVDGACLTVAAIDPAASTLTFGVAPETLRRTSLGERAPGDGVNLERALTPSSRMGGHFVQGHVDGTGEIVAFRPDGDSLWVTVRAPPEILRLLVPKGFVAVDGTSLTVVSVDDEGGWFDFMLVRYTQDNIVLPTKKVGDKVNLEADILGKYVEKLLAGRVEAMAKVDS
uniref:Riboflavin synthase n=1 Tax=Zea mays TaxID=4577 RepID=A0A804RDU0_MAIZE